MGYDGGFVNGMGFQMHGAAMIPAATVTPVAAPSGPRAAAGLRPRPATAGAVTVVGHFRGI